MQIFKILFSIVFLFLLIQRSTFSQTPTILTQTKEIHLLYESLSILEDSSNQLHFTDIRKMENQFQLNTQIVPHFGLSHNTHWIKFKLKNLTKNPFESEWVIILRGAFLDTAEVFFIKKGGKVWQSKNLPETRGTNGISVDYRFPTAKINLNFSEEITVYLKLKSDLESYYPVTIMPYNKLILFSRTENMFLGIAIGGIILLSMSSWFLFISIRMHIFLFFIFHSIFLPTTTFIQLGFFQYFLPREMYHISHISFPIFINTAILSTLFFTQRFLKIDHIYPKLKLFLKFSILIACIGLIISFISITYGLLISGISSFFVIFATSFIPLISAKSGNKEAFFYLLSWIPSSFSLTVKGLVILGFPISSIFSELALPPGIMIHLFIIMFLLCMRIKKIKQEKQKFNHELLKKTEEQIELLKRFEVFVPTKILKEYHQGLKNINLQYSKQDFVTLFFSDMRKFTSFSESLSTQELMQFLNIYFERFNREVVKYGGVIDKYIGDAAMVIYNQPDYSDTFEADAALSTAVSIHYKTQYYTKKFGKRFLVPEIGIGIHSGSVIMGTIGAKTRKDFTVIGDTVNVASRLESLTKYYQVSILLSETTYQLLTSKEGIRFIDHVAVYGKKNSIKIYQKLTDQEATVFEIIQEPYQEAFDAYYQRNFKKSLKHFKAIEHLSMDNIPSIFIERCQYFLGTPPQSDWDGIFYLQSK